MDHDYYYEAFLGEYLNSLFINFSKKEISLIATLVSLCDIQSRWDCSQWFGIDLLRACLIATLVSVMTFRADKIVFIGLA